MARTADRLARALVSVIVALAGVGCGEAPAAADGGTANTMPPGFCAGACAGRDTPGCVPAADCATFCETELSDWDASLGDAFARCAREPLCYETIESCTLRELHGLDAPVKVTLSGSGFEAYEGKVVRAWHDPGRGRPFGGAATITGGRFAFEWTAPIGAASTEGPLLLAYIDEDGDGRCDAKADVTHSGYAAWDGNLRAPGFRAVLTPPLGDADFVCNFPP